MCFTAIASKESCSQVIENRQKGYPFWFVCAIVSAIFQNYTIDSFYSSICVSVQNNIIILWTLTNGFLLAKKHLFSTKTPCRTECLCPAGLDSPAQNELGGEESCKILSQLFAETLRKYSTSFALTFQHLFYLFFTFRHFAQFCTFVFVHNSFASSKSN